MKSNQQEKLGRDYQRYLEEAASLKAEGKAIGSFIAWQYANGLVDIKIAKTWEEHKRVGILVG